jgi:hypothetical protein
VWRSTGQEACCYVYSLTDDGIEAVEREAVERMHLLIA